MTKIRKQRWKTILTYFLSGFITLLLIEIGFRVVFYKQDTKVLSQLEKFAKPPHPKKNTPFGNLIRIHDNPKIIYEWKPNISAIFKGARIKINQEGFRGKVVSKQKGKNTVRIMGLGDSVMFGWGVGEGENFMEVLERLLNEAYPACHWEMVNTAVPGYTTWMEVETLLEKGLNYEPDLVIISFVNNDLQLPSYVSEQVNYFSLKTSFVLDYFRTRQKPHEAYGTRREIIHAPNRPYHRRVPPKYQGLEGIQAYQEAMTRLKALSQEHGFDLLVIGNSLSKYPAGVAEIWEELALTEVKTPSDFRTDFIQRNQIADPEGAFILSEKDQHPSALGHQFIAEDIFRHLSEGMLESLCPADSGLAPQSF